MIHPYEFELNQQHHLQAIVREVEQRRLLALLAKPPFYTPLMNRAGRAFINIGQRLAAINLNEVDTAEFRPTVRRV